MINKEIRDCLLEHELTESVLFENPSFDDAIIGYTD